MLCCTAVHCDNCGSPLDVPPSASFVSCRYCGSGLAIQRTDTGVYTEQSEKLSCETEQSENDATQVQRRPDLEKLDREWNTKRQSFQVDFVDSKNPASDATATDYVGAGGAAGALAIMFFLAAAGAAESSAAMVGIFLGFFLSLFCFAILWQGFAAVDSYHNARDSYLKRRAHLLNQDASVEHPNAYATPPPLSVNSATRNDRSEMG